MSEIDELKEMLIKFAISTGPMYGQYRHHTLFPNSQKVLRFLFQFTTKVRYEFSQYKLISVDYPIDIEKLIRETWIPQQRLEKFIFENIL